MNALADQFASLSAAAYDGVLIYDSGVVLKATPGAAALFGRTSNELDKCPASNLFTQESSALLMQHLGAVLRGSCPAMAVRSDGSQVPVEATVQASLTFNGRRVQVVALRNVTSEEAMEHLTDRSVARKKVLPLAA